MGRRKTETESIEKNLRLKIEEQERLKKLIENLEKVKQKPIKVLNSKGEVIKIIKNI